MSNLKMSTKADNKTSLSFRFFLIWTFILFGRPQDFLLFLQPLRIALVLTLFNVLFALAEKKSVSWGDIFKIRESKRYTFLYLLMIIGIPFADHRGMAFDFIFFRYAVNMIYFFVFLYQVDSFNKMKKVIFFLSLSILFYGIAGFVIVGFSSGRLSFGTMHDPNDLALFFVSLFPLSMFFIKTNQPGFKKMIAATAVVLSLFIIILTGSRGGLLSLAIVLVLLIFSRAGGLKRFHKIAVLIGLALISIIFSSELNLERYASLLDLSDDYNITRETGRLEVWKKALKLSSTYPLTGVGVDCFRRAIGYARAKDGRIPRWQAIHNSYLQILVEVGSPGFIVFLTLISGCLRTFLRIMKTEISIPDVNEIKSLNGLIFIGFMGFLVGTFFLSQAYGMIFTLFFALSGVMVNLFSDVGDVEQEKTTAPLY